MAPINLPDGSQVSEIVLPDGSTASEVLAPDGSTVFSAIPDVEVSRPADDSSVSGRANGIKIEARSTWPSFYFEVSANSSSWTSARLEDTNNNTLVTINQSLTAGDIVEVNYELQANTSYYLRKSANGTAGYVSANYPYEDDGGGNDLAIVDGVSQDGNTRSDFVYCFSRIGNLAGE